MKILKNGKPAWWVGRKVKCDCKCELELEMGDKITMDVSGWGPPTFHICCPQCNEEIAIGCDPKTISRKLGT